MKKQCLHQSDEVNRWAILISTRIFTALQAPTRLYHDW